MLMEKNVTIGGTVCTLTLHQDSVYNADAVIILFSVKAECYRFKRVEFMNLRMRNAEKAMYVIA